MQLRGLVLVACLSGSLMACSAPPPAAAPAPAAPAPVAAAPAPEAMSVTGKALVPMELPAATAKFEANLQAAEAELAKAPDSPDALIWVGRRQGYLWQYQNAIATFTRASSGSRTTRVLSPSRSPQHHGAPLRRRHRRLREGRRAHQGQPDEIEPDGAPNAAGKPRSTLQFNIWYHLGLAYYLKADFANAKRAYDECLKVSDNDDSIAAISDWLWMT